MAPAFSNKKSIFFFCLSYPDFAIFRAQPAFISPFYSPSRKMNCTYKCSLKSKAEENCKNPWVYLRCGQSEVAGEQSRERRSLPTDKDDKIPRRAVLVPRNDEQSMSPSRHLTWASPVLKGAAEKGTQLWA